MCLRAVAFVLILLFAATLSAQKTSDVVVMKNGDRITCEIKNLEGGVLYVKLDYADGTVALQWSKVARLESKRLFIVKTERGSVYTGELSTGDAVAGEPVKFEVAKPAGDKVELQRADVVTIGTTAERFIDRFNGDISLGFSYSKGNQSTQYSLSSSLEYPRDRWTAKMTFNSNLSSNSGSDTTTRNQLNLRANHLLPWRQYFYAVSFNLLQSSEQGIGMQTNLGGGVGYYFKNSSRTRISVVGGVGWQRTNYSGSGAARNSQNSVAGIVSTEMRFFRFKKTSFNLEATLLPSITDPGRFYFKLNQSYYIKLFRDLSWNISFYGNWDTRPPTGLSGSDYGTSTGLGWTFGNK